MSKIIDDNEVWFQEVSPRSYYNEGDLERTIIQNLETIFPEFKALPFKLKLLDPGRNTKSAPDLAMVKTDYSEWYLIEVELGKHTIKHVVDQVTTFFNCSYDDTHATYIHQKSNKKLNLVKLKKMIASKPPELMVIVNEYNADWASKLSPFRCKSCVFQIYHNNGGNALYRLEGDHPLIKTDFCYCKYQNNVSYMVEILDKSFLDSHGVHNGAAIDIEFRGKIFLWTRTDAGTRVFLECNSKTPPLDPISDRYKLYIQTSVRKRLAKNVLGKIFRKIFPKTFSVTSPFTTFSFAKD